MYVGPVRRKKINLWLLILIILFIIAIVFTIIHIFNSSRANSDYRASKNSSIASNNNISNENTINRKYNGSGIGKVSSFSDFYDIETNTTQEETNINRIPPTENFTDIPAQESESTETILELNNHKYVFNKNKQAILLDNNSSKKYIQINSSNYTVRLTTDKFNYSDLKSKSGLRAFLQEQYNVLITSDIKTGVIKNTDLLLCTISENQDVAYLFITPLSNSEILCLKIYNSEDMSTLIKDISKPIDEISSIKASIQ